jgi:Heterokaryon incompatibility protein (HET)
MHFWGCSDKPFRMEVEEYHYIPLTTSLHELFRNLRYINAGSKTFWVDQVCINQEDHKERSAQVSMMGSVYRNATQVITYIGPATAEDYRGIRLARILYEFGDQHFDEEINSREIRNSLLEDKFPEMQLPAFTDTCWEALHQLLVRPWSRRSWIVQENILNQNTIMVCGIVVLPWELLTTLPRMGNKRLIPSRILSQSHAGMTALRDGEDLFGLHALYMYRKSLSSEKNPYRNVAYFLDISRFFRCCDPKDKIYSLLGLIKNLSDIQITPDYTVSTSDVYIDATK